MKKRKEFNLKEEVQKEITKAQKMMDPRLKRNIILLVISVISITVLALFISLVPTDDFKEKDKRIIKNMTYKELIKKMTDEGFIFDGKKNPEGYILKENNTTYLIKKFYKENYIDSDFTIYAYSNYGNRQGFVINEKDNKYKVYNYDRGLTLYCKDNGELLDESNNQTAFYNQNINNIIPTINKLETLKDSIFGGEENEKK